MHKMWAYEDVKNEFEKRDCVLLETEYKNYSTPMRYIATCGHEHRISLNNFLAGKGDLCRACRYVDNAHKESRDKTIVARESVEAAGCILLSETVPTWKFKFKYIATCGHVSEIDYAHWSMGCGRVCAKCSRSIRYSDEFVREEFKKYNCELISDYVNCKTPVTYRNENGKIGTVTFDEFLNGRNKKGRGDGIPPWRSLVFTKDDYTCDICGDRGGDLEAHHLYNYADYAEYRTSVDNGITLCKSCHRRFHKENGFRNNTKEQYESWKREYRGKYEPNNS